MGWESGRLELVNFVTKYPNLKLDYIFFFWGGGRGEG